MDSKDISKNNSTSPKKVFLSNARIIPVEELKILSDKEKELSQDCTDRGVWLELFCPDDSCLIEEERIKLVSFCEDSNSRKNFWLKVFCPDDSCEVVESTKLP